MNRAIARIFVVGALLFVALIANVTYLQVIAAPSLRNKPQNHRRIAQELKIDRGRILGFNGSVLVGSVRRSGYYYRVYPQGSLAPQVIGYHSVALGESGIEESMNDFLTGKSTKLGASSELDKLLGRQVVGADVKLTLVPAVQRAAQSALTNQTGAVVVLDPKTGAVIASASSPTYSIGAVESGWARLRADRNAPLLNRVTQGLYPPGSSFKVLTAAAALDTGVATPSTQFNDTGTYVVSGGKVTNYGGEIFGPNTFTQALTSSINTTFGRVGDQLGRQRLVQYMQRAGFWQTFSVDLPRGAVVASARYKGSTVLPTTAPMDPLAVAWAAVGQENVLATPLQMAMVAAAVANDGTVVQPYLVQQVTAPGGAVVQQAQTKTAGRLMSSAAAQTLNTMMQQVVLTGTGVEGALPGVKVAGKTGTAERRGANQAWFIAFAPADAPRVAIAVTIENTSGTGGAVAAPLAAAVMKVALAQGQLP